VSRTGRPRWYYFEIGRNFRRVSRSRVAGEALPMPREIREGVYRRQSGRELTARQRRRLEHKSNRALP
jgi:hypothetical protein